MVRIGKPDDIKKYIIVDSKKARLLHQIGILPEYRDGADIYFKIDIELQSLMKGGKLSLGEINKAIAE